MPLAMQFARQEGAKQFGAFRERLPLGLKIRKGLCIDLIGILIVVEVFPRFTRHKMTNVTR